MLCFRLLNEDEPAAPLAAAVDALRQGQQAESVFDVDPASFRQVPNAPFAYWVSPQFRRLFVSHPKAESATRRFTKGLCTTDDTRFLRTHWEVQANHIGRDARNFESEAIWSAFAKGGEAKRFYSDHSLVIKWASSGRELKAYLDWKIGRTGQWSRWINSIEFYFKPGITWPLRAARFSPQALPAGCIFSVRGYAGFAPLAELPSLLGLAASQPFDLLFKTLLGRFGFPEFVVGALQHLPFPVLDEQNQRNLAQLCRAAWRCLRQRDLGRGVSQTFLVPTVLAYRTATLGEAIVRVNSDEDCARKNLISVETEIDALSFEIYDIPESDRMSLKASFSASSDHEAQDPSIEEEDDEYDPTDEEILASADYFAAGLLDYAQGCAFGRWDIRYATGAKSPPPEPDPFEPLPICPPGMLQNAAGLPVASAEVPADYPLPITWSGILVDDPHQPDDIERRVREVFAVIYGEHADARVDEAVTILGASSLRDYLLKPAGFFAGHLKRHSKSRRQAPIYWPLSSPKGLTTVWLYYHRLTPDTFFTVLREHIKPRLEDEERRLFNLKQQAGPSATPSQVREIGAVEDLVEDLRAFRDELQRIAPLWRPDLNDGVIINHAPLWRMANHAPWRKALKETWEALVAEKYDWSHIALHLWPERVIPKCAKDRSLAIAHELEEFFWAPDLMTTAINSRQRSTNEIAELVNGRTSPAVKAALDSLLTAPAPAGGTTKRGRKKS